MVPFEGSLFNGNERLDLEKLKSYEANCVNEKHKIKFKGLENYNAYEMKRPSIFVNKCSGENCRTDEEIKSFLDNKELQVFVLAKSYNTTNYNPEEKL